MGRKSREKQQRRAVPKPPPVGKEGVPVPTVFRLAGAGPIAVGATIGGIECQSMEQAVYHIHAHLAVFVDGQARQIPYGIGIAQPRQVERTAQGAFVAGGACFAWLHTHASDGIIHIESPSKRTYILGDFFDVWGEPLSTTRVGGARGKVTTISNGQLFNGSPRRVPLLAHAQIQLDVGRPLVAPEHVTFPNGL